MRKKNSGCSYLWVALILLVGLYFWGVKGLQGFSQVPDFSVLSSDMITGLPPLSPMQGLSPTLRQVQVMPPVYTPPVYNAPVYTIQPQLYPQVATDTVYNAYAPPLRYNDVGYRQVGYLTGVERLPLFGRSLRYDKWYYYTLQGGIKLPVEYNRRKCSVSPGCDSVSDGDTVLVEGQEFKVNLYEMDMVTY